MLQGVIQRHLAWSDVHSHYWPPFPPLSRSSSEDTSSICSSILPIPWYFTACFSRYSLPYNYTAKNPKSTKINWSLPTVNPRKIWLARPSFHTEVWSFLCPESQLLFGNVHLLVTDSTENCEAEDVASPLPHSGICLQGAKSHIWNKWLTACKRVTYPCSCLPRKSIWAVPMSHLHIYAPAKPLPELHTAQP